MLLTEKQFPPLENMVLDGRVVKLYFCVPTWDNADDCAPLAFICAVLFRRMAHRNFRPEAKRITVIIWHITSKNIPAEPGLA